MKRSKLTFKKVNILPYNAFLKTLTLCLSSTSQGATKAVL